MVDLIARIQLSPGGQGAGSVDYNPPLQHIAGRTEGHRMVYRRVSVRTAPARDAKGQRRLNSGIASSVSIGVCPFVARLAGKSYSLGSMGTMQAWPALLR